MEEKPNPDQQTVREQLNKVAEQWANHGEYPDGIAEKDVQELSRVLFDQLEDCIETYVNDTTLSQREAEIRALTKSTDEHHHLLTEDAVALILTAPDTGFGKPTESDESDSSSQPITTEEIRQHSMGAKKKIKIAKQTISADTFPNPEDVLTNPRVAWLDWNTVNRLRNEHEPDERTFDDIVTRLLDETETRRTLEDFARGYLNARGQDNVAQLAIEKQSFETGALHITAHTAVQDELPDIVTETDAITHYGHRYDLRFAEDLYGPNDHGRITLYASDTIIGMDKVTLEDGLAAADAYMRDLLERDDPLSSRTVA